MSEYCIVFLIRTKEGVPHLLYYIDGFLLDSTKGRLDVSKVEYSKLVMLLKKTRFYAEEANIKIKNNRNSFMFKLFPYYCVSVGFLIFGVSFWKFWRYWNAIKFFNYLKYKY